MKNKTIIIILAILVVILISYVFISAVVKPYIEKRNLEIYNQGIQEGVFGVVNQQTTQGVFFYINESQSLDSMELNELCGRLGSIW